MQCCDLPWTEHAAAFDAHRARVAEAHAALLAELDPASSDVAVLTLHAPVADECAGCDRWGPDSDYPPWPCRTYQLLAERHGRRFVETSHGTEMDELPLWQRLLARHAETLGRMVDRMLDREGV